MNASSKIHLYNLKRSVMAKSKFGMICFTISMLLILSFTYKQKIDCSKIKTGRYYYYTNVERAKVDIIRTKDMQMETVVSNGNVLKSKIIWKTDCSYDMYINSLSETKLDSLGALLASVPVSVNILKIETEYYIAKWNVRISNREMGNIDTIYFKN